MPDTIARMIETVAHAEPSLPCQIHSQRREVKHHPAKDIGDGLGVSKDGVTSQMRVGAGGVAERCDTDADGGEARRNHGLHKQRARATMQSTPLSAGNRDPHHNQSHRAGSDV